MSAERSGDYLHRPRNVFARNWRLATMDVTVGNPWRLTLRRKTFRIFTAGPIEHRYTVHVGPVRLAVWPKAKAHESGSPASREADDA